MMKLISLIVGSALLAAGCASTDNAKPSAASSDWEIAPPVTIRPAGNQESPIGKTARALIGAHAGQRIEIFDKGGNKVPELPENERGSVSIYRAEGAGQDNYTFEADGIITKHMRSYGPDFAKGLWQEVKYPANPAD